MTYSRRISIPLTALPHPHGLQSVCKAVNGIAQLSCVETAALIEKVKAAASGIYLHRPVEQVAKVRRKVVALLQISNALLKIFYRMRDHLIHRPCFFS